MKRLKVSWSTLLSRYPALGLISLMIIMGLNSSSSQVDAIASPLPARSKPKSQITWRVVVTVMQSSSGNSLSPTTKADIQVAWEKVLPELAHTDVEIVYIEDKRTSKSLEAVAHPTSLLNKFCSVIGAGKTLLNIVIGNGPAARFLVTSAASLKMPTLWVPYSHREFYRQAERGKLETRFGASSEEIGVAASILMHKTHWHAFNLLIDTTILPINHLLHKDQDHLTPRNIIYIPTEDKTLDIMLRRLSEEGGRGTVFVMACDFNNAKKIVNIAGRYDMLGGRFLWLWIDVKAELRLNEPNIIGNHVLQNARVALVSSNVGEIEEFSPKNMASDSEIIHHPSNLASEIIELQAYQWRKDDDTIKSKKTEKLKVKRKRDVQKMYIVEEDDPFYSDKYVNSKSFMPLGMLVLRPVSILPNVGAEFVIEKILRETAKAIDQTMLDTKSKITKIQEPHLKDLFVPECLSSSKSKFMQNDARDLVSKTLSKKLRENIKRVSKDKVEFHLFNLQGTLFPGNKTQLRWTKVGMVKGGKEVKLDTIIWPGGGIVPSYIEQGREKIGMPKYKIVTALAPPFSMVTNLLEGTCIRGLTCKYNNEVKCCFGYSIDLLFHVSQELNFRFDLYVVKDGLFGKRKGRDGKWNGIVGDLIVGRAQMAFAPLSVSSRRVDVIDFTTPYYFGGVSLLTAPKQTSDIPLLAFLQPFSTELWVAVFTSLNITAMVVAAYEWLSPFGLNPWGRQRSKNFSIASALWVMWGLLCGHLVAFKAPKSWPNKFLINVWGGFSVIFVASYTANIAALIAGRFFHSTVNNYRDRSLLVQKVGAPKASAAEFYIQKANPQLWAHMASYSVANVESGVEMLRNGSLDVLIADTPILDYYRATDNGCSLQKIGDTIGDDSYAVGLTKGHPLKESLSRTIANFSSTGLLDILQDKWFGGLLCIRGSIDAGYHNDQGGQPRPLGIASVAGVFCLLGLGMVVGLIILTGEFLFYKYTLPGLRHKPKTSVWRSRNVMFFSQKLYRFINCVELVSPHHAARELVHTVRQGQITALFQKSVKRKEHEQRRRRRSKAQFFEMIQEIRRVQQEEKNEAAAAAISRGAIKKELAKLKEQNKTKNALLLKTPLEREKCQSSSNLSVSNTPLSPLNLEASAKPREFTLSSTNLMARSPLDTVGRRLSHSGSPPPLQAESSFNGSPRVEKVGRERLGSLGRALSPKNLRSPTNKNAQAYPVFSTLKNPPTTVHYTVKSPLLSPNNELASFIGRKLSKDWESGLDISKSSEALPSTSAYSNNQESGMRKRNQSLGDTLTLREPTRRSKSQEKNAGGHKEQFAKDAQISKGRTKLTAIEKAKRQQESETKKFSHHCELHPP